MFFSSCLHLIELDAETDRLLARQTVRNPLHREIGELIARYDTLLDRPECVNRALLAIAKLQDAQADLVAAFEALCRVAEGDSPAFCKKAAARTLSLVRQLRTKKYRLQTKNSALRDAMSRSIGRIIELTQNLDISRQIEIHFLLFCGDLCGALDRSFQFALTHPNGVADFMTVAKVIFDRGHSAAYIDDLANMLHQLAPALRKAKNGTFLLDLRVGEHGIIIRDGRVASFSLEEIKNAMGSASKADIVALASDKSLFLFRYPECEPIKQAILDRFLPLVSGANIIKKYFEKVAQTETFWADAAFRERVIDDMLHRLSWSDGPQAELTRGSIALMRGELTAAQAHFTRSIKKNTIFEETGATSFFIDLTAADEKDFTHIEADFTGVEPTSTAYVCCADLGYFSRYARAYVTSLRNVGDETRVHFHLSAPSHAAAQEAVVEHLGGFANVSVSSELSKLRIPTYYASMRFLRAPDFLAHVADRIVLTDVDVVFHRAPAAFTHAPVWNDADLGLRIYDKVRIVRQSVQSGRQLFRYPRLLPWTQVNAACVVLLKTKNGLMAANNIASSMHRHLGRALSGRDSAWWIDQNMLFTTLLDLKAVFGMRIVNIEDVGLPFGSFSYEDSVALPGGHPLLVSTAPEPETA